MAKLIFQLSLVQSSVIKCHMILQKSFLYIDLLQPKTLFINCFIFLITENSRRSGYIKKQLWCF